MARFILLPPKGVRARSQDSATFLAAVVQSNVSTRSPLRRSFGEVLAASAPAGFDPFERGDASDDGRRAFDARDLHLIDALHEDGAKLVDLNPEDAALLARTATLARVVADVEYSYNPAPRIKPRSAPANTPPGDLVLCVRCAQTGAPLAGLTVTLLTDRAACVGAAGATGVQGEVRLPLGSEPVQAQLLHIAAPGAAHWGLCEQDRMVSSGETLALMPFDPALDVIAPLRAPVQDDTPGTGVRIAVIDSGLGPHPDLMPFALINVVPGQPASEGADNGIGHGTHVAGTIAGRGTGFRGIAPGAQVFGYRVGGSPEDPPTSYAVMKALDRAADAGCIIINLSLSTVTDDIAVREAIRDVNLRGCVVIAAAGNGWREPIAEPARFDEVIAVSAYGDTASMPPGSDGAFFVDGPTARERPSEFVAGFANVATAGGAGIGLIAPGVGIISFALGGGRRVLHGTSMATAIVSGQLARLLSESPEILAMPPDHARSLAIRNLASSHARRRGFGIRFEGFGAL
ncbi:S8 family serine peptidase [Sphingomonas sp. PB2P19]|uniref:S8 family peptidase n=1 Tax=Sphingomonas rhamnosi TaxID=3096156 RepID=UPI002FC600D5